MLNHWVTKVSGNEKSGIPSNTITQEKLHKGVAKQREFMSHIKVQLVQEGTISHVRKGVWITD